MAINGGPSSTNNQNPRTTINGIAHPRNLEGQLAAGDHIPPTNQPTNNATNGHQNDQNANSENSDLLANSATEQHSSVHDGNNAGRPTENLIIENEHRAHFFDQSKSIDTPSPSGYSNANPTKLDETNDQQQLVSEGGNDDDDDERKMNDMEEEDSNNVPVVSECCPICLQPFTEASNKKVLSKCFTAKNHVLFAVVRLMEITSLKDMNRLKLHE
ncbi:hypothetical protein niasHS_002949 [Heterodera schachtii]|uniref:Uncharacterized protein n=1 Tax=Heterodera schachtii TaxID=97005 RepID=A0ABD2K9A3_HETSC